MGYASDRAGDLIDGLLYDRKPAERFAMMGELRDYVHARTLEERWRAVNELLAGPPAMGVRAAAELLGVSRERVRQIANEPAPVKSPGYRYRNPQTG